MDYFLHNHLEMHRLFGYAGQILYVDLNTGKTRVEKLDESVAKKYVGGLGLGVKLWLDNALVGVDPLSVENPLVLAIGPVADTIFPTGGNGHVFVSKSPHLVQSRGQWHTAALVPNSNVQDTMLSY